MLWAALALEKGGRPDAALAHAAMACETDMTKGGQSLRWTRCLAMCCRGRVLASQARLPEARAAFDAAAAVADAAGYTALEAAAARDLARHAPESLGNGEADGAARATQLEARLVGGPLREWP